MSRVTDFDDVYADSRGPLLVQLYAYCGDADVADDALDEAFIAASRRWRRLSSLETPDRWLRQRAIRRIDRRPGTRPASPAVSGSSGITVARPSAANGKFLAALRGLDRVSRRLMIVRRIGDTDLPSAAREVGLTEAAAEQVLARASTTLHAAGLDATPAGLQTRLLQLGDDLAGRPVPPARTLRRAGTRRRDALALVLVVGLVAVGAGVWRLSGSFSTASSPTHPQHPISSTGPGTTTAPQPHLSAADLLTAKQVSTTDGGSGWQPLPSVIPPTDSVYGSCVEVADNPPPDTSWVRSFAATGEVSGQLRQVLLLAPSVAEANRAFRQVSDGFGGCPAHQLVDFAGVRGVGDHTRMLDLRYPTSAGAVSQTVLIAKSGPAVTVLSVESGPAAPSALSALQLARLAAAAVNRVCQATSGGCATPPYSVVSLAPPGDGAPRGFLAAVDLPLVPGVMAAWSATDPATVVRNPSATACDRADFAAAGATSTRTRTFRIPSAVKLPATFGISETIGAFATSGEARGFVASVSTRVRSCPAAAGTWAVPDASAFTAHQAADRAWELRHTVGAHQTTYRLALVRRGEKVAEVTFTPGGGYDVSPAAYLALARRAAVRLGS